MNYNEGLTSIQVSSPWIGHLDQELHGGSCAELLGIDGVHQELEEPFAAPDLAKRLQSDDIVAPRETLHKLDEPGITHICLSLPVNHNCFHQLEIPTHV